LAIVFSSPPSLLRHLLTLILSSFIVLTNGEYLESDGFYTVNVPTRQAILVEGSGTDASNTDAQIPYFTRL
jgi:hypothetical protein